MKKDQNKKDFGKKRGKYFTIADFDNSELSESAQQASMLAPDIEQFNRAPARSARALGNAPIIGNDIPTYGGATDNAPRGSGGTLQNAQSDASARAGAYDDQELENDIPTYGGANDEFTYESGIANSAKENYINNASDITHNGASDISAKGVGNCISEGVGESYEKPKAEEGLGRPLGAQATSAEANFFAEFSVMDYLNKKEEEASREEYTDEWGVMRDRISNFETDKAGDDKSDENRGNKLLFVNKNVKREQERRKRAEKAMLRATAREEKRKARDVAKFEKAAERNRIMEQKRNSKAQGSEIFGNKREFDRTEGENQPRRVFDSGDEANSATDFERKQASTNDYSSRASNSTDFTECKQASTNAANKTGQAQDVVSGAQECEKDARSSIESDEGADQTMGRKITKIKKHSVEGRRSSALGTEAVVRKRGRKSLIIAIVLLIAIGVACVGIMLADADISGLVIKDPLGIAVYGAFANGSELSATVGNSVSFIDFSSEISIHADSTYEVFTDSALTESIGSRSTALAEGDNVFYVRVTSPLNESYVYKLTVRRKPLISIYLDDGIQIGEVTVEEGNTIRSLADPQKVGHTFCGWFYQGFPYDQSQGVYQSFTLTAVWEKKSYNVTLVADYGRLNAYATKVTYGESFVLETPTGDEQHAFYGWYADGVKITNGIWNIDRDIVLTAKWLSKVFAIQSGRVIGLSDYGKTLSNLVIPEENGIEAVTSIASNCFMNMTQIKEVTLPDCLEDIGSFAFFGCKQLAAVNLYKDNELKRVGGYAFFDTTWLNERQDECVCLGSVLLHYNGTQTSLSVGAEISSIAGFAFTGNTFIADIAFEGDIESIGEGAFANCTSLGQIILSSPIPDIGRDAFKNTAWLNNHEDGAVYLYQTLCGFKGTVGALEIKEGTLHVADYALYNKSLTSLTLPESLLTIGKFAFSQTQITEIDLKNVQALGEGAFGDCAFLSSVKTGKITELPEYGFFNCKSLLSLDLSAVKVIDRYALANCTSLIGATLSSGLERVNEYAFANCIALSALSFGKAVAYVGTYALYNCPQLKIYVKGAVLPNGWSANFNPDSRPIIFLGE
ncbi:MAG: leucine-rich repeat protein [Clostridia bacterium]|nr:leucine-rich repeat protein [Clostridia bacterium]